MGILDITLLHFAPLPSNGWGPRFPVNFNRIKDLNGFLFTYLTARLYNISLG